MKIQNNLKQLGVFKDFSDESIKTVFEKGPKEIIEITLLFNKEKLDVVCAPTHHFCNLGCKMCHLTNKGLNKQMKPIEVDSFIEALIKSLCKPITEKSNKIERRTKKDKLLISFMGVGEPLLNLKLIEDVFKKEKYLQEILGYSEISYAISTMMPNDNMIKLTEMVNKLNIPLKVHFSLHTPINNERFDLIPNSNVSIEEAFHYLIEYRETVQKNFNIVEKYQNFHRTKDPIEIHYTLIKELNDNMMQLEKLVYLLKDYQIPIKFIRFNPLNNLEVSLMEETWLKKLHEELPNLRVKTYSPPGKEIGSSCGEFTKHYYHSEIETEQEKEEFDSWKLKHQIFENI